MTSRLSRESKYAYLRGPCIKGIITALAYGGAGYGYGGYGYGQAIYGRDPFRWRGPYIADAVTADPWGNRYMANVFSLHVPVYDPRLGYGNGYNRYGGIGYVPGFHSAAVCYSAGANGSIETHFRQQYGWITGGDDRTVVLAGVGGLH